MLRAIVGVNEMIPLMNNTKWREVFEILARQQAGFVVTLLRQTERASLDYIDDFEVQADGLADGAIGVPTPYSQIERIRIPKQPETEFPDHIQGRETSDLSVVFATVQGLGKMSVVETNTDYIIEGYKDPNNDLQLTK